jgi:L-threonylcarbamoyladenylate synthase
VGPLTGTSANRSGEPPMRVAEDVLAALGSALDLILDGGATSGGMPSTVVDTVGPVRILREGVLKRRQIEHAFVGSGIVLQS